MAISCRIIIGEKAKPCAIRLLIKLTSLIKNSKIWLIGSGVVAVSALAVAVSKFIRRP